MFDILGKQAILQTHLSCVNIHKVHAFACASAGLEHSPLFARWICTCVSISSEFFLNSSPPQTRASHNKPPRYARIHLNTLKYTTLYFRKVKSWRVKQIADSADCWWGGDITIARQSRNRVKWSAIRLSRLVRAPGVAISSFFRVCTQSHISNLCKFVQWSAGLCGYDFCEFLRCVRYKHALKSQPRIIYPYEERYIMPVDNLY